MLRWIPWHSEALLHTREQKSTMTKVVLENNDQAPAPAAASSSDDVTEQMAASRDISQSDLFTSNLLDSPPAEQERPDKKSNDEIHSSTSASDGGASPTSTDGAEESTEEQDGEEEQDSEPERWVFKAKLPSTSTQICGHSNREPKDGPPCTRPAVALWEDELKPEDHHEKSWHSCLECQMADFGDAVDQVTGWPVDMPPEEVAVEGTADDSEKAKKVSDDAKPPTVQEEIAITTTTTAQEQEQGEEEGKKWDLKSILAASQIRSNSAQRCDGEYCDLVACSIWFEEGKVDDDGNPLEPCYACLDCQQEWWGGFPTADELPIKFMTKAHKEIMAEKCTGKATPPPIFPDLPEENPNQKVALGAVTPPPGKGLVSATGQAKTDDGKKKKSKKQSAVTPSPVPPRGAAGGKNTKHEALVKKWQDQADAMGGGRVVTSKPEAKKVIFDMLHDAFRPMNITDTHKELKGIVPSAVLKSCLDDMALDKKKNPFDEDSDDEDEGSKKGKTTGLASDDFSGSLRLKSGRNANNCLYFVDHTSAYVKNNGNGLPYDEQIELMGREKTSSAELLQCKSKLKEMSDLTTKLNSEPTNEELDAQLEQAERALTDLKKSVEDSRQYQGNQKIRAKTAKSIDSMTAVWRKRKRICMDFLQNMEDVTEGTVSVKKCLSGDGQIYIDSDESLAKAVVEMRKRQKTTGGGAKQVVVGNGLMSKGGSDSRSSSSSSSSSHVPPNPDFVAVTLSSSGIAQRVIVE